MPASGRVKPDALPLAVAGYYRLQPEPHRATVLQLRARVLRVIPDAAEVIKYAMPTFVVSGKPICGLMVHTRHIGFYPYSGSVLEQVPDIVVTFGGTKSALHLPIDKPVPIAVIRAVIKAKLDSMGT